MYLPSLSALRSFILETNVSAKVDIGFENRKASKFARHLSRWTTGGAFNDNRFAKGEILINLDYSIFFFKTKQCEIIFQTSFINNIKLIAQRNATDTSLAWKLYPEVLLCLNS